MNFKHGHVNDIFIILINNVTIVITAPAVWFYNKFTNNEETENKEYRNRKLLILISILSSYGWLLYWLEEEVNRSLWHCKIKRCRHVSDGEHVKSSHNPVYLRLCTLNIGTGFVIYFSFFLCKVIISGSNLSFSESISNRWGVRRINLYNRQRFKNIFYFINMFCGNFVLFGNKNSQTCLFWIRLFLKDDRSPAYGWKMCESYQHWYMLLFYFN